MTRKSLELSIRRLVVLLICRSVRSPNLTRAQENARVFIFSGVLYNEDCVSFGAKFFKPQKEAIVDRIYLYYLTGWANRNDTNRMVREAKYSSLNNSESLDHVLFKKIVLRCHCYCHIKILIVGLLRLNEAWNQIHELLFCDGVLLRGIPDWQRVWPW